MTKVIAGVQEEENDVCSLVSGVIFAPPPANIHYGLTVFSGHFGPPLPFWALGPPPLPGLPMAIVTRLRVLEVQ